MEGNPICIQIPWDRNPEALAKWAEGKTGFPWIDAIMTQLRQEGWIHHLARHAVACFLTRGDLWVSWESGVRVSALSEGRWPVPSCQAWPQAAPSRLGYGVGSRGPGDPLQILLAGSEGVVWISSRWAFLHGACGDLGRTMAVGPKEADCLTLPI